jgi:predicted membrane protein
MDGQVRYRIGNVAAGFILAFTVIADLSQFLLTLTGVGALLAPLVTFLVTTTLFIWFLLLGVNYIAGKRAAAKAITALSVVVAEFIPVINALPTFTIGAIVIIWSSRAEDKDKQKPSNPKKLIKVAFGPQKLPSAANDNEG